MSTPSRVPTPWARAILLAFVALVVTVSPTLGGTSAPANGYGTHAVCRYMSIELSGSTGFRLKKISVLPPTLYGHEPGQEVGWRFVVKRRYDQSNWYGPWKRVFTSSTQKSVASPDVAASFSNRIALIGYVDSVDRWPDGYHTTFRVTATFYWYTAEGAVDASESFAIGVYPVYRDGDYQFTAYDECEGAYVDP